MASISATSSQLTTGHNPSLDRPGSGNYERRGVKHIVDTASNLRMLPPDYHVLPPLEGPLLAINASIPVIDLSGLDGSIERRMFTIQAIASACAEWGFFRILNHGIKFSLMEEMLSASEGFFSLTWEEKMKYALDEDFKSPVRYGTSLNTSAKHALHWRDYLRHFCHPNQNNSHLWPDNPPNYRHVAKEFSNEVWLLALKMAGAISEGLGLDCGYIENSLGAGCQILSSNCYPPCPEPNRTLGLPAHSDHGAITILMQNDVEGLQVKHNEEWIVVPHVPGSFVVNLGDYLEILSNGRYKSVEHRAVVNEQRSRISIAVSNGPELNTPVAPASPLVDEKSEIEYKAITYKDYMTSEYKSSVRGKTPLQGIIIGKNS